LLAKAGCTVILNPLAVCTVTIKLLPLASTAWCGLRSDVRLEFDVNAAALRVVQRRNIVLPLMLSSICRQRDEHTQGGKCSDLHALLPGRLRYEAVLGCILR
jgi:hypothetical protein